MRWQWNILAETVMDARLEVMIPGGIEIDKVFKKKYGQSIHVLD